MSDREVFFLNDRPILIYEARRPDPFRPDDPDGIPAQPTDVWYRVFNGTSGVMVDIGGDEVVPLGSEGSNLYMSAMDEDEGRGALIYVRVPEEVSAETGDYTFYITTEYGDGLRITHNQRLQIAEYR